MATIPDATRMRFDVRRLRLAGSGFFGESRAIKIDWEGPPAILLSIHDITEAVRAREALSQNVERFRNSFANTASGMVILDLEGRILQANQTFCDYLQIDEVPIAVLCDPKNMAIVRARGEDPEAMIALECRIIRLNVSIVSDSMVTATQ